MIGNAEIVTDNMIRTAVEQLCDKKEDPVTGTGEEEDVTNSNKDFLL